MIDFIQLMESCSKHTAIMRAKQILGVEAVPSGKAKQLLGGVNPVTNTKSNGQLSPSTPAKTKSPPYEKLFGVLGANLAVNKQGQGYLKERGLSTKGVGYNATSWPQMKHCIIYPLKDKSGRIVGLYGRSIINEDTKRPGGSEIDPRGKHYYTKDRQGLYPGYPNATTDKLILTESIIDAVTLLQLPEITKQSDILACYGTNGLTQEHLQAIQSLKDLKEVIFFFDGDAAGKEAVLSQGQKLKELKPNARISYIDTPQGEDVNSLAVNHPGKEAELLSHLMAERQPVILSSETLEMKPSSKPITAGKAAPATRPTTAGKPVCRSLGRFNSENPYNLTFYTDTAHYAVKGGLRKQARSGWELDSLKVSLLIETTAKAMKKYRQKLDLYEHKQIEKVCKQAADRLNLRADLVEWDLYQLTDRLEAYRDQRVDRESL